MPWYLENQNVYIYKLMRTIMLHEWVIDFTIFG